MKFRDLLENGFIGDKDVVRLRVEIREGSRQYIGNWYEDGILNCTELEVDSMSCDREWGSNKRIWELRLKTKMDTQKELDEQKKFDAACARVVKAQGVAGCYSSAINVAIPTEDETC